MGEQVAAVPGLCRAHLVVAVVVFVCARAGRCRARAGRCCAHAGRCGTCSGRSLCWVMVMVICHRCLGMLVTLEVFGVVDEGHCGWVSSLPWW